ncbi:MAG: aldo/keto reductase, partial [Planctomycetes bacterium]|nr:aldo/keto reductase [Planctomycetota bacterium]
IFLQTKTQAKDAKKAAADIERFRRELGVETIDSLLIHCMQKDAWPTDMRPVIDVMMDAKEKGRVRAIGVSCHTHRALSDAVECEWMDVHLVRINPFGTRMDDTPEQIAHEIRRMHEKKRGIIGMKIYGEGDFKTVEQRRKSLKFVLHLGTVQAFTIGFRNVQQIDETLGLIAEVTAERS